MFSIQELERMLEQFWTEKIIFFPVRHHRLACAWHVSQLIREEQPGVVLIEGPESFSKLLPFILQEKICPLLPCIHIVLNRYCKSSICSTVRISRN